MRPIWIRKARVYAENGVLEEAAVEVREGRIAGIYNAGADGRLPEPPAEAEVIEAEGFALLPGFVDVHVHGGGGGDAMGATRGDLERMCAYHARHGTTSLLVTTLTAGVEPIAKAVAAAAAFMRSEWTGGAKAAGVHLEGPFLNPAYCGAQDPRTMRAPSVEELEAMLAGTEGVVRLVTLAPEMPGADRAIEFARSRGMTVSAGHTGATYEEMREAVKRGVAHATHLFNGMRGIHHRDPGAAGGALLHPEVTAELICDGVHVHPDLVKLTFDVKTAEKVALITDCISCAGCPDGEYRLGDLPVIARDGVVTLRGEDGKPGGLAGSTLTMRGAFLNAMRFTGRTPEQVLPALTLTPARQAGIDKETGSIAPGKAADLVLMDAEWNVVWTMADGRIVYRAEISDQPTKGDH